MGRSTDEAVAMLREYARFIDENAEALVGDLDSVYVCDGIDVSFRMSSREAPAVNVGKTFFAIDRKPSGASHDRRL